MQKGLGKMAKKLLTAIAGLAVALVLTSAARANTIDIAFQEAGVNGGAITTEASGSSSTNFAGAYGKFLVGLTGTGSPALSEPDLDTTGLLAFNYLGGAATLTIYVTETGLTSPTGHTSLLSEFNVSAFFPGTTSIKESTEYSLTNALYSGTQLATDTFTAAGSANFKTAVDITSTKFSETEVIVVKTTGFGAGAGSRGVELSRVPEPATLSLLGFGLSGLGVLGLRKKQQHQNG